MNTLNWNKIIQEINESYGHNFKSKQDLLLFLHIRMKKSPDEISGIIGVNPETVRRNIIRSGIRLHRYPKRKSNQDFPDEYLPEIVKVIRSGLCYAKVPNHVSDYLLMWCKTISK